MFERIKFAKYALQFERAFKSDHWEPVRECFHPDATYTIEGSASEFDGETCGPDAIVASFKRMLDRFDRKFDRRKPGFHGWPRVSGGELVFPWKADYTLGDQHVRLTGISRCRFEGSKIHRLSDAMNPDECARWAVLADSR
jgi:SnoaL-like domain